MSFRTLCGVQSEAARFARNRRLEIRPCVSSINAPLLTQHVLHNVSKILDLPSGEGVSTH